MSMNREQRRKAQKQQLREWMHSPERDRMLALTQNGITPAYAEQEYARGHKDGYEAGAERTLKMAYAALVLVLLDNGNDRDTAIGVLREVDWKLQASIDADEDILEVFDRTGIYLQMKGAVDRVQEVQLSE